jgi:prolyl 4-hydroxylase
MTVSVTEAVAQAAAHLHMNDRRAALPFLEEAADQGNADAMIMLAQWHADGVFADFNPNRSASLAKQAASTGHAVGCFFHAQYLDQGFGQVEDMQSARLSLIEAARGGFAAAWTQLAVLISVADLAHPLVIPTLVRAKTMGDPMAASMLLQLGAGAFDAHHVALDDIAELVLSRDVSQIQHETLSGSLLIWRAQGVFNPLEALYIAHLGAPHLAPSTVVDPHTGEPGQHPTRKADATNFGPNFEDLVVGRINRLIARETRTLRAQAEPLALLRYNPGGEYKPHLDSFEVGQEPMTGSRWDSAGQRILTALLYLNDGYEGGETTFDRIGVTVRGVSGDLLVFSNVTPEGKVDVQSRHAGKPVRQGQKWLGSRWIRAHVPAPPKS